jgi:FHS family L-fucose permease-like MFS transporter
MQSSRLQLKIASYVVALVFFMWGALTVLNDLLAPHLKDLFQLNYAETMLIQFCFFLTYALLSIPFSLLLKRIGYKFSMMTGLTIAAIGCLFFIFAASSKMFGLFLIGLFILAGGIVCLQVAANPLITLLGNPAHASSRLTFAQALNSLGTTIVPLMLGGLIMAGGVQLPYMVAIVLLVIITILIMITPIPKNADTLNEPEQLIKDGDSIWNHPALWFGVLAIFIYVGSEVSTGTLLINYLGLPQIANMDHTHASRFLAFFWGGALVGRFFGAWILTKVRAGMLVAFNGGMNVLLLILAVISDGHVAMWSILALGLFNSVMFPTIFAMALTGLGKLKRQASGLLCTAIVGGAFVPELQGILADWVGLQQSFVLLIFCYGFIACYGYAYRKIK